MTSNPTIVISEKERAKCINCGIEMLELEPSERVLLVGDKYCCIHCFNGENYKRWKQKGIVT